MTQVDVSYIVGHPICTWGTPSARWGKRCEHDRFPMWQHTPCGPRFRNVSSVHFLSSQCRSTGKWCGFLVHTPTSRAGPRPRFERPTHTTQQTHMIYSRFQISRIMLTHVPLLVLSQQTPARSLTQHTSDASQIPPAGGSSTRLSLPPSTVACDDHHTA